MKPQVTHILHATEGYICQVEGGAFSTNVFYKLSDAIKEAETLSLRTTKTVYILALAGKVNYQAKAVYVEAGVAK